MNFWIWTSLFLLLIWGQNSYSEILCENTNKCKCYAGPETEFQCPPGDYSNEAQIGMITHIEEDNYIEILCHGELKEFSFDFLPNVTVENVKLLQVRFCPPPSNVSSLLDWFSIENLSRLEFNSVNFSGLTLAKEYFEGLEKFRNLKLILNKNEIQDMDEDVFSALANLAILDLQDNNIQLKVKHFQALGNLSALDLSGNKISNLPIEIFLPLENLAFLHLRNNNLSTIENRTFQGLNKLESLELSGNQISQVSETAFNDLPKLARLSFLANRLSVIPKNIFQNNSKLEKLRLSRNPDLHLPNGIFEYCPLLTELTLSSCNLNILPARIFEPLKNLTRLELAQNKFENLSAESFSGLSNLHVMYLSFNKLTAIPDNLFGDLRNLRELYLENNFLRSIGRHDFEKLNRLAVIHLERNQIENIAEEAFEQNTYLEEMYLSRNLLESVSAIHLINKVKLSKIDLNHNRIKYLKLVDLQTVSTTAVDIYLAYNNITVVDFENVESIAKSQPSENKRSLMAIIYLNANPIRCNCLNYDLWSYFNNLMDPTVKKLMFQIIDEGLQCEPQGVDFQNIAASDLTCSLSEIDVEPECCPKDCECYYRRPDTCLLVDCSARNLTKIPDYKISLKLAKIINQTQFNVERNLLKVLTKPENSTAFDNITMLFAAHNRIEEIHNLPSKLQVLTLNDNQLGGMSYGVLEQLNRTQIRRLSLQNNPWRCDCAARNLTEFLRQHSVVENQETVLCNGTSTELRSLYATELCPPYDYLYLILFFVCLLLMLAILFALYYKYSQEIKIFMYAKNMCLWWVSEEELDKDKLFDAFISYSHLDEDFLVQNLLPVLEGGENPYKLCLHGRDWTPGQYITDQISSSVRDSRRTIILLSKNFLNSSWAQMEFRTAHVHAMTEGRARVIIVLYGDVNVEDVVDQELKTYLKTNTYVQWGSPHFWNQLRYAMPHNKAHSRSNRQKHANMMSFIDDKFKLASQNGVSNPNSTPPIKISATYEKEPLSFIVSGLARNEQLQTVTDVA